MNNESPDEFYSHLKIFPTFSRIWERNDVLVLLTFRKFPYRTIPYAVLKLILIQNFWQELFSRFQDDQQLSVNSNSKELFETFRSYGIIEKKELIEK